MGTKMILHRYGPVTKDWDETLYIVDEDFLNTYGSIDPILPTNYPYEPNKGLLKVYLNGQRILNGGAYLEIDSEHIQLALGVDEEGNPIELQLGDEVYIEVYNNLYCSKGHSFSGNHVLELQKEIMEARKFKPSDTPFPSLDARLDFIQRSIELIESGMANVDIHYEYNEKNQIIKQIVTGEIELVREFTFNSINQIEQEVITYSDVVVTKTSTYDLSNGRLLQTRVRVEVQS